jgi:ribosomal-protein-alanine N-acetyltransferase
MKNKIIRPVTLSGENVILKDLRVGDVTQDYVDWMNDMDVVKYTESRFALHTIDSTREFVELLQTSPDSILFGMFSPKEGLHIGNIKIGPINWQHGLGDIGLIIGRKTFWGKGIAAEAICLVRDYALATLSLHKVTAACYASNYGSSKAFLKAGFHKEGVRSQHALGDAGDWEDVLEFGLVKTAFQ